jgi:HNH endonuclease
MDLVLRNAVRQRAQLRCEYCRLPELFSFVQPFQVEHIVARKHRGPSVLSNLALACDRCNLWKGADLTSLDPITRKIVRLFHPRRMKWSKHFRWDGPVLVGRSPVGRTTVALLQMNHEDRIQLRQALLDEGLFPPE